MSGVRAQGSLDQVCESLPQVLLRDNVRVSGILSRIFEVYKALQALLSGATANRVLSLDRFCKCLSLRFPQVVQHLVALWLL